MTNTTNPTAQLPAINSQFTIDPAYAESKGLDADKIRTVINHQTIGKNAFVIDADGTRIFAKHVIPVPVAKIDTDEPAKKSRKTAHADCTHENTKVARAKCRRERAKLADEN